ncbi:uncharacterized protein LOC133777405 [Humulus lupulus]|uniref:uncharacterized protein LOC133777405 n=1 Tax=Humulus lupulus TaxID=3486 RepID=UPI002B411905|nr:uncharacterized protein LOC133777405 [Humulus lupulus]XP_062072957.1 uncharacterized protein LOC133777405 [Humulus lupulus]
MDRALIKLDFFSMEKNESSSKSQFQKFLHRQLSFLVGSTGCTKDLDSEVKEDIFDSTQWLPDSCSLALHKHCFTTISNFQSSGCWTLTSFVGGRHHQLLESLTQVLRDFRNSFLVKKK